MGIRGVLYQEPVQIVRVSRVSLVAYSQSKSECYRAKVALENQDQPVGVRIKTAVNILNNVIEYVDEISQKGFRVRWARSGQIPWKAQFEQWKILVRFEQYFPHKSAQSDYQRFWKSRSKLNRLNNNRVHLSYSVFITITSRDKTAIVLNWIFDICYLYVPLVIVDELILIIERISCLERRSCSIMRNHFNHLNLLP